VQGLFQELGYPFTIRADSITAVGAPSSIGYLVRALYWLHLVAKQFSIQVISATDTNVIEELSEEQILEQSNDDENLEHDATLAED
jgi:hypothetical protein